MLALVIAPFFIALLILIFVRLSNLLNIEKHKMISLIVKVLLGIFLFSGIVFILISFITKNHYQTKKICFQISYYWLAFILYILVFSGICLLIRYAIWLILKKKDYNKTIARYLTVIVIVVCTTMMSIYGINNAHNLRITNYEVVSSKQSNIDELNIVLISDLHIGYNIGIKQIQDMANKINNLNPDVVILAGDIFDNEYEAIENPQEIVKILNSIKSKYGKYTVLGNHDIQENILMGFTFNWGIKKKINAQADERMIKFINDSGFELLYDSYKLIENSVYIYGRPDLHKNNFGNTSRKNPSEITSQLDLDKTIICVDHEPGEINELQKAGVDLDLSGHTHNGQVWPGTLTINLFWKNAYGKKQFKDMTSIVTSGVGLFGINMRTGCIPEIVNIKLSFKK